MHILYLLIKLWNSFTKKSKVILFPTINLILRNFLRHIKMTEKDLFGTLNSTIGGIGAALCSLFGTIVNVMAIVMILKRPKIKKHLTAPILFIMCMSNLTFSLISMPITSHRFFVRANWTNPTGTFCKLFPIGKY